jgi:predicted DNA-binding transcriptional regulator AlpA
MKSIYITNSENSNEVIETASILLSETQALELLNLGRTTFRLGIKKGLYPPPVQVGARRVAWRYSDLYDCVQALPEVEWRGLKPAEFRLVKRLG